jgi:uncharacterized protein YjgD (DUF1641 family)
MAEPISYTPKPARVEMTAHEELHRLLETCHRHGVLRLANDLIASNTEVARVLVEGVKNERVMNAFKNLSVFLMALSSVPPADLYRIVFALRDGVAALAQSKLEERVEPREAPGLKGAYHMLNDEHLWRSLTPVVEALKAFATGLDRRVENPISDYSGKPGRTQ